MAGTGEKVVGRDETSSAVSWGSSPRPDPVPIVADDEDGILDQMKGRKSSNNRCNVVGYWTRLEDRSVPPVE